MLPGVFVRRGKACPLVALQKKLDTGRVIERYTRPETGALWTGLATLSTLI